MASEQIEAGENAAAPEKKMAAKAPAAPNKEKAKAQPEADADEEESIELLVCKRHLGNLNAKDGARLIADPFV